MLSLNSKKFPNTVNPFLMKLISYTAIILFPNQNYYYYIFVRFLAIHGNG